MTEIGNSIEEYDVGEQLGRGGFAVVYRGRCRNTGQEVAIKKIDKGKIAAGGLINRVRQEVTIHSQLSHPAILKLFAFFEDELFVYLVLELCHKGELQKYIRSLGRVLTEDEAREYLRQIVFGMLYLHSHSIMHRDLTLSNLLLDSQGRIKIADFGLATQLQRPDDRHMTMCGTPNYISPEVATRSSHGLESDVWSLGCMLFIMLVGHPPFDGHGVKESIFTRVVIGDYKIPSYVSANARSLISECLKKNPRERIKLQAIPHSPFMQTGTKDVSRMSDSGLYTMSTVTSANQSRIPLTVITESNISESESKRDVNHSAKLHNDPFRRHVASPPVKIKSSPRDLLPPNAGVIDSLKRKFTPLPSLKRGEDFAFSSSSLPFPKRERDISEERRKHQGPSHHKENSTLSNEERSDSSVYALSHGSDDTLRHQRRGMQRGSSEQNLRQGNNYENRGTASRRHRSLERNNHLRGESLRSDDYKLDCQRQDTRASENRRYETYENTSGNGNSMNNLHYQNVNSQGSSGVSGDNSWEIRSRARSRTIEKGGNYASSHGRSKSEGRDKDSNYGSFEENSLMRYRELTKGKHGNPSHKNMWDPQVNFYGDNSHERHRDRLREPEHRSYREDHDDVCVGKVHSCCQTLQHRSWCDRGSNNHLEKNSSALGVVSKNMVSNQCDSSSGANRHFNPPASSNSVPEIHTRNNSPKREECGNRFLGDIPPLKYFQEPVEKKNALSVPKSQSTPTKKLPKANQTIQQQVSPLSSKRLKPIRQRTKNAFMNIMDNGEICLEFLSNRGGKEKVVDVCRISPDGMRIVLYQPDGGSGCQPGDNPPPLPEEGADLIFSYENLPQKYWKKYIYAARFVKVVRAKTPKITYYSEQAKGMLMENSPDPDFEALFYGGLKMVSCGNDLTVSDGNCTKTVPRLSAPDGLQEPHQSPYLHFKEVRDHCLYIERVLTEVMEKTCLNCFPVIMGRKPPGIITPPTSARGNSQPGEDKENIPVSMQSFQCSGRAAEQLGSFQESVSSLHTMGSYSQVVKSSVPEYSTNSHRVESPVILKNPGPRVFIQDIGWATQGSNGVISVEYLDSTQILVSSNNPKVMFTDEARVTRTYSSSDKLPLMLQQKLAQMKIILGSLARSSHPIAASSSTHCVGLR